MGNEYSDWRKASYSNGSGSCVEAASGASAVAVRDTTNRDGRTLVFSVGAWATFTASLQ
jgi:hypothetical protein